MVSCVVTCQQVLKSEAAGRWLSEEQFEQHEVFPVARVCRFC